MSGELTQSETEQLLDPHARWQVLCTEMDCTHLASMSYTFVEYCVPPCPRVLEHALSSCLVAPLSLCRPTKDGEAIPFDATHIHYGKGQTSADVEVPKVQALLCLLCIARICGIRGLSMPVLLSCGLHCLLFEQELRTVAQACRDEAHNTNLECLRQQCQDCIFTLLVATLQYRAQNIMRAFICVWDS